MKKILTPDQLFNRHIRQQELNLARLSNYSKLTGQKITKQVVIFDLKDLVYSVDPSALKILKRTIQADEVSLYFY